MKQIKMIQNKYEIKRTQILELENSELRERIKEFKKQINDLERLLDITKKQLLTLIKTKNYEN